MCPSNVQSALYTPSCALVTPREYLEGTPVTALCSILASTQFEHRF
jgi:hypothetical protein